MHINHNGNNQIKSEWNIPTILNHLFVYCLSNDVEPYDDINKDMNVRNIIISYCYNYNKYLNSFNFIENKLWKPLHLLIIIINR